MHDGTSLPVVCAANATFSEKLFVHLKILMNHPILKMDEKLLWLWLATQSTNNQSLTCSFTYEQIASAVNVSIKDVHRILFRLKLMGILFGNIPIWYGVPTNQMCTQMRHIRMVLLDQEKLDIG